MAAITSTVETSKGRIKYQMGGTGEPHVVFINGGSGPIEGWMRILPEISESSTVLAYSRLGVAGSDKPKEPQDGITIVETLREVLGLVKLEPPYLLVGHSLGGLYANLYARLYPNEISGIVFLESSHPKDLGLDQYQGKVVRSLNKFLSVWDSLFPHKQFDEVHFVHQTVEQIQNMVHFPDIPVFVVTGGKDNKMIPEEVRKKRMEHQLELLSLSSCSKHIPAEKSGHFPQFTEPGLVIQAIKSAIAQLN
jgi:pimeloyl-ACP methyl ester carboxylesterase